MRENLYFLLILAIIVGTIPGIGLNKHFTAEAQTPWMGPMFGRPTYNCSIWSPPWINRYFS